MQKSKRYKRIKFSSRLILQAIEYCRANSTNKEKGEDRQQSTTTINDEQWTFDNLGEFVTSYSNDNVNIARLTMWWDGTDIKFAVDFSFGETSIDVKNKSRTFIENVFSIFDGAAAEDKISLSGNQPKSEVTIFIGHGRSKQWTKLKDHLQDKHALNILSYETGARAGHTIRDILDSMSEEALFALLVLTGEDKTKEGIRARQNVIHECGLFQGRLGFDRAILLVEKGVELASNFDGIQQLRFNKGRISEVFGDVLATIKREFGPL